MAKKTKPLPAEMFIRRVNEGTKDEYLSSYDNLRDTAELGETIKVGRYQLVEELDVTTDVLTTITHKHDVAASSTKNA